MTCLFCGDSECQCPVATLFDPGMFDETDGAAEPVTSAKETQE